MKKLLCIDGNSILNRSFYGIRLLTTKDGFPTNALYGLVNVISRELETLKPDYAAIAYDLKAPTFRHKMYADYKAGRHAMPDELRAQMPVSREFAQMLGLHILDREGYEADDILGTLAAMAEADPEDCMAYLLTGDKDSLQLISPRVHVLLAGNNATTDTDEAAFMEKYGVRTSAKKVRKNKLLLRIVVIILALLLLFLAIFFGCVTYANQAGRFTVNLDPDAIEKYGITLCESYEQAYGLGAWANGGTGPDGKPNAESNYESGVLIRGNAVENMDNITCKTCLDGHRHTSKKFQIAEGMQSQVDDTGECECTAL